MNHTGTYGYERRFAPAFHDPVAQLVEFGRARGGDEVGLVRHAALAGLHGGLHDVVDVHERREVAPAPDLGEAARAHQAAPSSRTRRYRRCRRSCTGARTTTGTPVSRPTASAVSSLWRFDFWYGVSGCGSSSSLDQRLLDESHRRRRAEVHEALDTAGRRRRADQRLGAGDVDRDEALERLLGLRRDVPLGGEVVDDVAAVGDARERLGCGDVADDVGHERVRRQGRRALLGAHEAAARDAGTRAARARAASPRSRSRR